MANHILEAETLLRLVVFTGILAAMLGAEHMRPFKPIRQPKLRHDTRNFALLMIGSGIAKLFMPMSVAGLAVLAEDRGWGLFNLLELNRWYAGAASIVTLDLLIYFQHRMFHRLPVLWRMHAVHHSDIDFSTTTALRFHPAEILLSIILKMAAVAALGVPPEAVLIFEMVLNGAALFNHANISLPDSIERIVRLFLVTPDMHRLHHSVDKEESNKNYGFNFPWWDWIFGSHLSLSRRTQLSRTIGLQGHQDANNLTLGALLLAPISWKETQPDQIVQTNDGTIDSRESRKSA
ncbi:MAG: sterol desaturase family protein [Oligoflexales bacterium]